MSKNHAETGRRAKLQFTPEDGAEVWRLIGEMGRRAKLQFTPEDGAEVWRLIGEILPLRDRHNETLADALSRQYPSCFKISPIPLTSPQLVLLLLREELARLKRKTDTKET